MNHISIEASRALASHLGIPQEEDPLAWRQSIAQQLDEMLDQQFRLIALLDLMDGDPDIEENGDERDSSWPAVGSHAFGGALDEGDEDADAGEDDGCTEPTLGSPEQVPFDGGNQNQWADGASNRDDYEAINEDGGDVQDEPHDQLDEGNDEISLGWGLQFNQLHASAQACRWGDEERWSVA